MRQCLAQPGERRARHDVAAGELAANRAQLAHLCEFQSVVALHSQAAAMVNRIIESDKQSMAALEQAEIARRSAATAMEKGETTLQAYRRVITPSVNSTPVNRKG